MDQKNYENYEMLVNPGEGFGTAINNGTRCPVREYPVTLFCKFELLCCFTSNHFLLIFSYPVFSSLQYRYKMYFALFFLYLVQLCRRYSLCERENNPVCLQHCSLESFVVFEADLLSTNYICIEKSLEKI